ncbi:hypothetical protein BDR04DRAFT_1206368 [Suillus decipiens]|nr:hypothetical protein BDR04DRAFT_1206368 [Suillus decipiens]
MRAWSLNLLHLIHLNPSFVRHLRGDCVMHAESGIVDVNILDKKTTPELTGEPKEDVGKSKSVLAAARAGFTFKTRRYTLQVGKPWNYTYISRDQDCAHTPGPDVRSFSFMTLGPTGPRPPRLAPERLGVDNNNQVIAGSSKRRKKEDQRKQDLDNDEYTEDVQPTSVRCHGCQKVISLDKRSRYYPGLWVKHRGKCPGIRKLKAS